MIAAPLLAALIEHCAPRTAPRTVAAIVEVESSGDSWSLQVPEAKASFHPRSYAEAVFIAHRFLAAGDHVSVGLAQVLLPRPNLDAASLLRSPCANLRAGASVLADFYAAQVRELHPRDEVSQQLALRRALSSYNSGSPTGAPQYTARVLASLGDPLVEEVTALTDGTAVRVARPQAVARRVPRSRIAVTSPRAHSSAALPVMRASSVLFYNEAP